MTSSAFTDFTASSSIGFDATAKLSGSAQETSSYGSQLAFSIGYFCGRRRSFA